MEDKLRLAEHSGRLECNSLEAKPVCKGSVHAPLSGFRFNGSITLFPIRQREASTLGRNLNRHVQSIKHSRGADHGLNVSIQVASKSRGFHLAYGK